MLVELMAVFAAPPPTGCGSLGGQETWHSALGGGVASLSVQQQASRIT